VADAVGTGGGLLSGNGNVLGVPVSAIVAVGTGAWAMQPEASTTTTIARKQSLPRISITLNEVSDQICQPACVLVDRVASVVACCGNRQRLVGADPKVMGPAYLITRNVHRCALQALAVTLALGTRLSWLKQDPGRRQVFMLCLGVVGKPRFSDD